LNLNFDPVFQPPLPNSQGGLTPPQRKPAPFIGETKKEFPWRPGRRSITPCGDGTQRGQGGKGREGRDRGGGKKRVRGKISRKGKTPSAAAKDNNFTPPPYWVPPCASATTKQRNGRHAVFRERASRMKRKPPSTEPWRKKEQWTITLRASSKREAGSE